MQFLISFCKDVWRRILIASNEIVVGGLALDLVAGFDNQFQFSFLVIFADKIADDIG